MKAILITFCICPILLFSQVTKKEVSFLKNEFKLFYSLGYTKTNFENTLSKNANAPFSQFLEIHPPNRPYIGRSFGFMFSRKITPKNKLSFFFNTSSKGQQSKVFYNYYGNPDTFNLRPRYGGAVYQVSYFSNEFGLQVGHQLFKLNKPQITSHINFKFSADVYERLLIRNFILRRKDGVIGQGCCVNGAYKSDENFFRRSYKNLSNRYFRFGYELSLSFSLRLIDKLNLTLQPQIQYLTNLQANPDDPNLRSGFIKQGTIYAAQITTGLSYEF